MVHTRQIGLNPMILVILMMIMLIWIFFGSRIPILGADSSVEEPKIPAPDPRAAEVPEGYRVEVAVSSLTYPSCIEFDDSGNLYVGEAGYAPGDQSQTARIFKFALDGNRPKQPEVVADKLSAPITDLLWHDGKLFISHRGKISILDQGKLQDIVTDLPSFGDHSNNQISLGPDGKLYLGQGTATNSGIVGPDNEQWLKHHPEVCEKPAKDIVLRGQVFESLHPLKKESDSRVRTSAYMPFGKVAESGTVIKGTTKSNGTILRMDLDGSNLEVYAWGFRNPYGVQWGPDKKLYVADAGSDVRGSRPIANTPEKLWIVEKDRWYGWPDYVVGIPVTDERFKPKKGPAPEFLMKDHPPAEKPWMTLDQHSSITRFDFSPNKLFGFEGHMFLASSGDQGIETAEDKDAHAGFWVKRIDLTTKRSETFFRTRPDKLGPKGLEYVVTAGPKRLVDLRFSPKGDALYVVDFGPIHYAPSNEGPKPMSFPKTGIVWRIVRAPNTR
jgi:glucose/arabinose dehydrogenase